MGKTIIGVDTGGTFTDVVLVRDGRVHTYKTPSTPRDFSSGILDGIRGVLETANRKPGPPFDLVHSSTVATNALLERKGARTALLTTRGFKDVLEIGRQDRPSLYDLRAEKPKPFVPPALCREVAERIDASGRVLRPLDPAQVERVLRSLKKKGVNNLAVCLLFSFLNPKHERRVARLASKLGFQVTLSSRVCPEFREFERTSTTVINAYVAPVMKTYLDRLGPAARRLGARRLRIIQSNGGSLSPGAAAREAVHTLLSGPAAGVLGALAVARQSERKRRLKAITFDMGGTSTDVALIDGDPHLTTEAVLDRWPVRVPMMDIHTVGAGGGSLARLDAAGALHVGPESAGADPGPCCYGKGDVPTVTDANLVLGRIRPEHFLGGRKALDVERSHSALSSLARRLRVSAEDAAQAVLKIVNANMVRAIRVISVERGYDPRDFFLISFGGAGGLHACDLAAELKIPRVLIPRNPGVLSAWGAVSADVVKDYARTIAVPAEPDQSDRVTRALDDLLRLAETDLKAEGFAPNEILAHRMLDMRYRGQSYELSIPFSGRIRTACSAFDALHKKRYGHAAPDQPKEIMTVRLRVIGALDKPVLDPVERGGGRLSVREVIDRASLKNGSRFLGPAAVVEDYATTYVPAGWSGRVDRWGNLWLEDAP